MLLGAVPESPAGLLPKGHNHRATDFSIAAIMARRGATETGGEEKISSGDGPLSRLSSPCATEDLDPLDPLVDVDDDDVEVDVEECSDGESASSPRPPKASKPSRRSPAASECGSEGDRDTPDDVVEKGPKKVLCNCEELLGVECHLETKDLWDKFHDLGTEMIITKTGR
ncbi:unnamed protein product [Acanthoscelides obtectus]|uniref:T-box domain-containing protein n=1 Tax=Acanthoscelides obtectus TaxID=200917 RepID=A0A9P0JQ76_ACAOB|nr:unnamed protein product [Acanthoscelides obtectus]CAK1621286.1 T-box protein H15 [Acanthoscelides obtectus]